MSIYKFNSTNMTICTLTLHTKMPSGRTRFHQRPDYKGRAIQEMFTYLVENTSISEACYRILENAYKSIPSGTVQLYICKKKKFIIYQTHERKLYCVDYEGNEQLDWPKNFGQKRMNFHKITMYYDRGDVLHGGMKVSLQWLIQHFSELNDDVDPLPKKPQPVAKQATVRTFIRV